MRSSRSRTNRRRIRRSRWRLSRRRPSKLVRMPMKRRKRCRRLNRSSSFRFPCSLPVLTLLCSTYGVISRHPLRLLYRNYWHADNQISADLKASFPSPRMWRLHMAFLGGSVAPLQLEASSLSESPSTWRKRSLDAASTSRKFPRSRPELC
jgi:hypothetical protein